jgi:hypothetical protein
MYQVMPRIDADDGPTAPKETTVRGTIHRLSFGVTIVITEKARTGYRGVVVNSTNPHFTVGDNTAISDDDFDQAQAVDLTGATITMLVYKVPTNGEREPVAA